MGEIARRLLARRGPFALLPPLPPSGAAGEGFRVGPLAAMSERERLRFLNRLALEAAADSSEPLRAFTLTREQRAFLLRGLSEAAPGDLFRHRLPEPPEGWEAAFTASRLATLARAGRAGRRPDEDEEDESDGQGEGGAA